MIRFLLIAQGDPLMRGLRRGDDFLDLGKAFYFLDCALSLDQTNQRTTRRCRIHLFDTPECLRRATSGRRTKMANIRPSSTESSYYDRRYRQGPALVRARRPYVFKTAALGVALAGLSFSIYWYTLKAIGQDSFDDVKVPDEPRKPIENKK
ncbi:hypothetical protein E4U09_000632 [Claviceps aff. purpurea]|uniref:Cytochrome c oxidase assembly factor 3 n=1 Tax=Claviceps aff. purpurea TaxID=1967640 RepID=A0A9P7QKH1_9HYPO|nr:hypothetical protein E4U09_000632 [Claviceps aff. purpurea]